jgi:DNA-directed RNA polymerase specialized sigma24 family protein
MNKREKTKVERKDPVGKESLDRLMRLLDLLSDEQRLITVLHLRDGKSFGEIGGEMGISSRRVRRCYCQALKEINEVLKRETGRDGR